MSDLWGTLLPLMIGSAVLPVQIAITVLLLQSRAGRIAGAAWVGGMTVVRLGQGLIFGVILETAVAGEGPQRPGPIASTLLLVAAVVFLISAVKAWRKEPDHDAPPPDWMAKVDSVSPGQALVGGVGVVALSPKLWVFTMAAIAAIAESDATVTASVASFLAFVVAAECVHLSLVGLAYLAPDRAAAMLPRVSGALARNGRVIKISLGVIFGAWFLVKALRGFGLI
jgi:hypothetical protein